MKIKKEHYTSIKIGMIKALHTLIPKGINNKDEYIQHYINNKIGNDYFKRASYDLLRASTIDGYTSTRFICDILYTYLTDSHIDTAIKKIMNEL